MATSPPDKSSKGADQNCQGALLFPRDSVTEIVGRFILLRRFYS